MTTDEFITLRLEEIETNLLSRSIQAAVDQRNQQVIILPPGDYNHLNPAELWDMISEAPSVKLSQDELLSDEYLEIALRQATGILARKAHRAP